MKAEGKAPAAAPATKEGKDKKEGKEEAAAPAAKAAGITPYELCGGGAEGMLVLTPEGGSNGGAPTADLAPMAKQAEQDYALVMAGIRELQAAQG